jgi:hypothetical protein
LLTTPTLATTARASGDAAFSELGSLLSFIEPLTASAAAIPGAAAPAVDPTIERAIQMRVDQAVTTAVASTERELAALRAEVARLGKRK